MTPHDWQEKAYAALKGIAARQDEIHVDDVLQEFKDEPHHPNAWGFVWQRALRDGVIERSGRWQPTEDPKKHKHNYPIYLSRIVNPHTRVAMR